VPDAELEALTDVVPDAELEPLPDIDPDADSLPLPDIDADSLPDADPDPDSLSLPVIEPLPPTDPEAEPLAPTLPDPDSESVAEVLDGQGGDVDSPADCESLLDSPPEPEPASEPDMTIVETTRASRPRSGPVWESLAAAAQVGPITVIAPAAHAR